MNDETSEYPTSSATLVTLSPAPSRSSATSSVALGGSPRGGPHVDESKLPPPDRLADGIDVVDLESARLVRVLTNGPSNDVTVIDVETKSVLKRIPAGASPWGIAVR